MGKTTIEWTDRSWNPLVGCEYASTGCRGCYAARDAFGRLSHTALYSGLAHKRTPDELPRFTGEIRLVPERLDDPLKWQKPARVFVNSMSDLFHPDVPPEFIAEVFATMALAREHTFQVLTKRPVRMARVSTSEEFATLVYQAIDARVAGASPRAARRLRERAYQGSFHRATTPLPNVWLGTSVEDQAWADRRIPHLLRTRAAVRFLSVEPLLGPVDIEVGLRGWRPGSHSELTGEQLNNGGAEAREVQVACPTVDWGIVGGESGPQARPMHPQWVRDLRDQCVAAGVPFHLKQWGEWLAVNEVEIPALAIPGTERGAPSVSADFRRVGKKAAGRMLDGRTWDEYPEEVRA